MSEYIITVDYDTLNGTFSQKRGEEIVRCRDCDKYEYREHLGRSYCCGEYETEPDGFCAWGERKEGGE